MLCIVRFTDVMNTRRWVLQELKQPLQARVAEASAVFVSELVVRDTDERQTLICSGKIELCITFSSVKQRFLTFYWTKMIHAIKFNNNSCFPVEKINLFSS